MNCSTCKKDIQVGDKRLELNLWGVTAYMCEICYDLHAKDYRIYTPMLKDIESKFTKSE